MRGYCCAENVEEGADTELRIDGFFLIASGLTLVLAVTCKSRHTYGVRLSTRKDLLL